MEGHEPQTEVTFSEQQPVVLLPGFGNDARDYSEPFSGDVGVALGPVSLKHLNFVAFCMQ